MGHSQAAPRFKLIEVVLPAQHPSEERVQTSCSPHGADMNIHAARVSLRYSRVTQRPLSNRWNGLCVTPTIPARRTPRFDVDHLEGCLGPLCPLKTKEIPPRCREGTIYSDIWLRGRLSQKPHPSAYEAVPTALMKP